MDAPVLDVRGLPGTREVLVCRDAGLFPVVALSLDGMLVAAIRGGAGHLGRAGRIDVVRSLDLGRTWSPAATVANSADDDRNPALGFTSSGALVLAYHRQGSYDDIGAYSPVPAGSGLNRPIELMLTRSLDRGLTWDVPRPLGVSARRAGSAFGKIVSLHDGTLLLAVYDFADELAGNESSGTWILDGRRRFASHILASDNHGLTWEERSTIAVGANETALAVLRNGDVLACLRDDGGALHLFRSRDGARTWTRPVQVTEPGRHPADLVPLSEHDVLLTYGNRTPPYRIEGRLSRDGGETWEPPVLAFSGPLYGCDAGERWTDLGYPSTAVDASTGRAVTVFYHNPDLPRFHVPEPTTVADRERHPSYLAAGYRAVAVLWDGREVLAAAGC